jgi:N-acetylglucosaminyldiphosphoundecaprenol N-acetyl-beta-D-mannosaminyltransferase
VKTEESDRRDSKIDVNSWELWGISLFGRGEMGVLELVEKHLALGKGNYWVATVNPEFMMEAEKDGQFKALLKRTSLNVVDGIGLIWAKEVMKRGNAFGVGIEILRGKNKENLVTGADLMDKMCAMAERLQKSVYFFGGWRDRAERTAKYFLGKYPRLKVAGYRAEDFDFSIKTDFLFVAYGMKKQEKWIDQHFDPPAGRAGKLSVKVVMGVGRSFDYYSGDLKRAPGWVRRMGMEWFYSLCKEPKRWKRQLVLPGFIWKVLMG